MAHSQSHPGQDISDSPDERRGHAATAAAAKKPLDAVTTIVAALRDLSKADQIRVLRSAAAFFEISNDL